MYLVRSRDDELSRAVDDFISVAKFLATCDEWELSASDAAAGTAAMLAMDGNEKDLARLAAINSRNSDHVRMSLQVGRVSGRLLRLVDYSPKDFLDIAIHCWKIAFSLAPNPEVPIADAARDLGWTERHARRLACQGRFPARRTITGWVCRRSTITSHPRYRRPK